jgi:hypothetical protein
MPTLNYYLELAAARTICRCGTPILNKDKYCSITCKHADRPAVQYVYFIRGTEGEQLIKIGYSADPLRRFKQIAAQSPTPVTLLGYIATHDGVVSEAKIHSKFKHLRRPHSEYFSPSSELCQYISDLLAGKRGV